MPNHPHRRWLSKTLAPLSGAFRDVVLISFFINIAALSVPIFVLQVYDRVVFHAGLTTLQALVIGILVVLLFDYLLRLSRSRLMQRVALRVDVEIGRKLINKIMASPLAALESRPGSFWHQAFRDVDTLRNMVAGPAAILLVDLPFAILFLLIIFVVATPIAWVLLVIAPLFALVSWRSTAVMGKRQQEEKEKGIDRDTLVAEMIQGRETVKSLALDASLKPKWEDRHADTVEQAIRRGGAADAYTSLGYTLTMLSTVALTAVGALAILEQQITIGALVATNMLSSRLIGPFNQLIGNWRTISATRHAVKRLDKLFQAPEEQLDTVIEHTKPVGTMTLDNLVYHHDPETPPVIDGVSLIVKPGGLHGMVGPNGCGKTTLIKLMQGLYRPKSGRITLDGADISQFSRRQLAAWIGYVPQDVMLFSGTIRDNIAFAHPDADDATVIEAAKRAGAHDAIVALPEGYATDIGESGKRLSGGVRQRIAVARALIGDPAVILLDEPTSHLDHHSSMALGQALRELAAHRVVIMVTHNPLLLQACHTITMMENGRIQAAGPAARILPRLFPAAPGTAQSPPPRPTRPAPEEKQEAPA